MHSRRFHRLRQLRARNLFQEDVTNWSRCGSTIPPRSNGVARQCSKDIEVGFAMLHGRPMLVSINTKLHHVLKMVVCSFGHKHFLILMRILLLKKPHCLCQTMALYGVSLGRPRAIYLQCHLVKIVCRFGRKHWTVNGNAFLVMCLNKSNNNKKINNKKNKSKILDNKSNKPLSNKIKSNKPLAVSNNHHLLINNNNNNNHHLLINNLHKQPTMMHPQLMTRQRQLLETKRHHL
mmetsp:Transcript_9245/g.13983  ORF Transcript_9245/g.13983 Transcript_9245/m.13983 type:complete len:234 (+) Transcript_9245:603-1304(+)